MIKTTFISLLLLVFLSISGFSQTTPPFEKSKIWLSGASILDSLEHETQEITKQNYYNFNPTIKLTQKNKLYENILDEYFSLFVVFKSNPENESNVFKLISKDYAVKISNMYINREEGITYDNSNTKNGVILTYSAKIENYSKKNSLSFEDFSEVILRDAENNQLMEVLYFPKILNRLEKHKIETYLSIKHGISLIDSQNYITSQNDTIWDFGNNKAFNHRITGIGKEDQQGLLQKQSHNSENDGLTIGFGIIDSINQSNKIVLTDKTFLLWGDNNKSTMLKEDENQSLHFMERIWKLQQTLAEDSIPLPTQIRVDKKLMGLYPETQKDSLNSNFLWLAVSQEKSENFNMDNATFHKQSKSIDDFIYFDVVDWEFDKDQPSLYFSFVEAPDFFALLDIENLDCPNEEGSLTSLNIIGGDAPYTIKVSGAYEKEFITKDNEYDIVLLPGKHSIRITDDNGNSYNEDVRIEKTKNSIISLIPTWQLNAENEVVVVPIIDGGNDNDLLFEWYSSTNQPIAIGSQFTTSTIGNYELVVQSETGCKIRIPFRVDPFDSIFTKDVKLYPNATNSFEYFTVAFTLKEQSDADISIFNTQGQLIKSKHIANAKTVEYQDYLNQPGMYFIIVESNGTTNSFRLLIK